MDNRVIPYDANKSFSALTVVCCIPAMVFFVLKEKNSNVSPAESRELNAPCFILGFYDR